MKLLIDIPEEVVTAIQNGEDYRYDLHTTIAQGIPYESNGDLISREALKKAINTYDTFACLLDGKLYPTRELKHPEMFVSYMHVDDVIKAIDNAPTVEPCYQTTSCLDCGNYDKENHNCPRYCEVIKEAINSRPQGEWAEFEGGYRCSNCNDIEVYTPNFCPNCGAKMKGGKE